MAPQSPSNAILAAKITRAASKQTYYTVRWLVDQDRVDDAYRAYAYFRWVDDRLDADTLPRQERLEFFKRQQALVAGAPRGQRLTDLTPEEELLLDLTARETDKSSGLYAYIGNMMAVMAFDAERRGRLISQQELTDYTHWLAVAVTEALHYFIGHRCDAPCDEVRYQAATGAHIAHMLRDTLDDARAGYYNVPREILQMHHITPEDVANPRYQAWVASRVQQARVCFQAGQRHLARIENLRCRLAGYAYIRRFEVVLDLMEREHYILRSDYPERHSAGRTLDLLGRSLWMAFAHSSRTLPQSGMPRLAP